MSGFVSQAALVYALPVANADEQRTERREANGAWLVKKRERRCRRVPVRSSLGWRAATGGAGGSRKGPRSLGPPAGARRAVGPKKGPRRSGGGPGDRLAAAHLHSLAERADSQGRTYQDSAPLPPSAPRHKSAECILRVLISHGAHTEKVMHPISLDYINIFPFFSSSIVCLFLRIFTPVSATIWLLFRHGVWKGYRFV